VGDVGARDREERSRLDELLTPSIGELPVRDADAPKPWRLGSQVYVAFFGGVLAVTAIAILNARRLGLRGRPQALMAGAGVLGLAGALVVASLLAGERGSSVRIGARIVALATYGVHYLLQRRADRVYHYHARDEEPYDSLLVPGLIACFTFGLVEAALLVAVAS
jgi:hypothetical protein